MTAVGSPLPDSRLPLSVPSPLRRDGQEHDGPPGTLGPADAFSLPQRYNFSARFTQTSYPFWPASRGSRFRSVQSAKQAIDFSSHSSRRRRFTLPPCPPGSIEREMSKRSRRPDFEIYAFHSATRMKCGPFDCSKVERIRPRIFLRHSCLWGAVSRIFGIGLIGARIMTLLCRILILGK